MRKRYPSDISREAFEQIRPLLESVRKQTKPRRVDLYEVFCGVVYLLKSGCQWRMLPSDYPKWRTVHADFAKWSAPGSNGFSVLERALKNCGWRGPYKTGAQILDELFDRRCTARQEYRQCPAERRRRWQESVGNQAPPCGRYQGLPHAIAVTTATVTDRKGALFALGRCAADLQAVQCLMADGGPVGQPVAQAVDELLGAQVRIAKRSEWHAFAVMPRRWVVERSFAWIEKYRRLWKNCERMLNTSLQFIHLAFLALLLRRS